MWSIVEGPKVMRITHNLARKFADMKPCPGDRALSIPRTGVIKQAIEDGSFRTCEWAYGICEETGEEERYNGKHTSHVLSQMNGDLPELFAIVTKFVCPTKEDSSKLYSTFDTRSASRNTSDINRVFASADPELALLPTRFINAAVTGMAYSYWEDSYSGHAAHERAELLLRNIPFVLWLGGMLEGKEGERVLRRGPVVAAMFRTYQKAQGASTEFWSAVRDASGPSNRSADRVLNQYLRDISVARGRGAERAAGKKTDSTRSVYVKCLHAWNAWRSSEAVVILKYHSTAKAPPVK